eukprot:1160303-Pelagomonas_calceolata.AAC.2
MCKHHAQTPCAMGKPECRSSGPAWVLTFKTVIRTCVGANFQDKDMQILERAISRRPSAPFQCQELHDTLCACKDGQKLHG